MRAALEVYRAGHRVRGGKRASADTRRKRPMTDFLSILSGTTPSVIALAGTLAAAGACGSDAVTVAPGVDASPGDAAPLGAPVEDAQGDDASLEDAAPFDAAPRSDGALTCLPLDRPCPCATGAYCLAGNAACIVPTAQCPNQEVAPADASPMDASPMDTTPADGGGRCPTGDKVCACATGSYCVVEGALCVTPTSPCPAH